MENKILYHYCSLDTFNLIMSNKTIRMCDSSKTNDYMEKSLIMNFIKDAFIKSIEDIYLDVNFANKIYDENKEESCLEHFERFVRDRISEPTLIACFSRCKNKLNQWQIYSDDGKGIAIGFNYDKLNSLAGEKISIEEVIYEEYSQKERITNIIKNSLKEYDPFNNISNFENFCVEVSSKLKNLACYLKSSDFNDEHEIRMIYNPPLCKDSEPEDSIYMFEENEYNLDNLSPVKFYTRNNSLVAYSDINFKEYIHKDIVSEIIIGPKSKTTETDLKYFLLCHGYNPDNIKICKSTTSYR